MLMVPAGEYQPKLHNPFQMVSSSAKWVCEKYPASYFTEQLQESVTQGEDELHGCSSPTLCLQHVAPPVDQDGVDGLLGVQNQDGKNLNFFFHFQEE